MIESLIALVIALVIIYVVYLVLDWVVGLLPVPEVFNKAVKVVIIVVAGIYVLKFLAELLGVK